MGRNQPKKLMLSREAVRDLTGKELEPVAGGEYQDNQPFTAGKLCVPTYTGDPCRYC